MWFDSYFTPVIAAFVSGVAGPLTVHWYKQSQLKKKLAKRDTIAEELTYSKQILSKIEDIKNRFQADRVWVSQFHNGGHYIPGNRSVQKFSIFYEVLGPGVDSVKMQFQNIPVALFAASTSHIYEKNYVAIPDYKDPSIENYGLKYVAEETGAKSFYGFAIFCIENKLTGVLGVEYTRRKKELDPDEIQELEIEAAQIGGVLVNFLKQK